VATKCSIRRPGEPLLDSPYRYDASAEYLIQSVEGSLRRLGLESVDLLMLHRPDFLLDPAEVADAFARLQQAGKVREFGVSNFRPSQLTLLQRAWSQPLITHQIELSLWAPEALEDGRLDQCQSERITPMAWSPMAKGILGTGSLNGLDPVATQRANRLRAALSEIHSERVVGALAWLLRHPAGVVPIIGTTDPERIQVARQALTTRFSREDWYRLLELGRGQRLP
jgi:predicted oxidoreductase